MTSSHARPSYVVGVDVGGTKTAVAVVDPEGKIYKKLKLPTEKRSARESIDQILEACHQAVAAAGLSWDRIAAVGVAIPGIYLAESGRAWAPNLWGQDQVPLREELGSGLQAQVVIDSDRAAYVLGEQWLGVARGLSEVVFLAVGTGIGAGIIANGRLCRGAGGVAGAVGWFAVKRQKKQIYKLMGCLEAEASGPALARQAASLIASGETSLVRDMAGGRLEAITAQIVVEAARRGDELALRLVKEAASYLGMCVANIISILNPEMVVLGGGLMQAGELLLEPIRREALEWAQPHAARRARIELTRLGEDAGLLGAARLALLERS